MANRARGQGRPGWQASAGMTMAPAKSRFCPIATEPDCRLVDERRIADWPLEIGIHQIMTTRTLLKRLEKVEEALKAQSIFSQDCICFLETEQPFFCSPSEEPVAAKVKCPLHGNRFNQPVFHVYVSQWRREKEPARRQRLSAQYRKAWEASFPTELWPAVPEEETEDGKIFFRLKDGTKLWVSD